MALNLEEAAYEGMSKATTTPRTFLAPSLKALLFARTPVFHPCDTALSYHTIINPQKLCHSLLLLDLKR